VLYFGYLVARLATALVPRRSGHVMAAAVAALWYAASPRLRRNLDANLRLISYLRDAPGQRARVGRRAVRNFAVAVTDFLMLPRINRANLEKYVDVAGFQEIKEMLAGRPAILVTAHLGSWEIAAAAAALVGIDLHIIAWDHPDSRVAKIFRRRREAKGLKVLSVRAAARSMPSVLETSSVALAADRDFTGQGMRMNFLGASTTVPSAYAALARSMGIPVIPVICLRLDDGRYHLFREAALRAADGDRAGETIVGQCLRAFEKYVEKHPEQWYRFDLLAR